MLDEIDFEWANINISGFALMHYSHTKRHMYVSTLAHAEERKRSAIAPSPQVKSLSHLIIKLSLTSHVLIRYLLTPIQPHKFSQWRNSDSKFTV